MVCKINRSPMDKEINEFSVYVNPWRFNQLRHSAQCPSISLCPEDFVSNKIKTSLPLYFAVQTWLRAWVQPRTFRPSAPPATQQNYVQWFSWRAFSRVEYVLLARLIISRNKKIISAARLHAWTSCQCCRSMYIYSTLFCFERSLSALFGVHLTRCIWSS